MIAILLFLKDNEWLSAKIRHCHSRWCASYPPIRRNSGLCGRVPVPSKALVVWARIQYSLWVSALVIIQNLFSNEYCSCIFAVSFWEWREMNIAKVQPANGDNKPARITSKKIIMIVAPLICLEVVRLFVCCAKCYLFTYYWISSSMSYGKQRSLLNLE